VMGAAGTSQGMAEMAKEMSKIKGVPVLQSASLGTSIVSRGVGGFLPQ
jgi:hypothetical protein